MWLGFKKFMLRGNVIDLAVAVIMAAAFGAVVTALVKDLITPLLAALIGKPDFSALTFTINKSRFLIGDFINALISFVLIALVLYFAIVIPANRALAAVKTPAAPKTRKCPECLSDISLAAKRCPFCTSPVTPAT